MSMEELSCKGVFVYKPYVVFVLILGNIRKKKKKTVIPNFMNLQKHRAE